MKDTIAIDFGTMRTKVAYRDPNRDTLELMRLGQNERPFVPSLFFLGEDGRRLYGDDAAEYLDSDPLAFLPRPLKRELREQWVRAGNRVKATPTELLSVLFAGLRKRTSEIPCFRDAPPTGLFLTVPAQYGPPDRDILTVAAGNAGFREERIGFIDEPIAAAQAWLAEFGGKEKYVVVLDCGGGTLDWACLHRTEAGKFEVIPELPPGGDNRIGGFDIDEAMFARVDDAISDESTRTELQTRGCFIRDQIRAMKERHSRTGAGGEIRVGNERFEMPPEVIADIIARRFTSQACQNLCSYLEKVRGLLKIETPTVLLVGGSARLRGFKDAVSEQGRCNAVWWERSEYATVLGAVVPLKTKRTKKPVVLEKPSQQRQTKQRKTQPPPVSEVLSSPITPAPPTKEAASRALSHVQRQSLLKASIMIGSDIPADRIVNAWQAYAQVIPVSDVVLLHDATMWGNGKKGLLSSATQISVSATSDNKTWSTDWKDVRWLCLRPATIAFDDVVYALAAKNSPLLFEALDAVHAIHRTPEFFANPILQADICRALLNAQFLPIIEVFGSACLGPMVVMEDQGPDFADSSTTLLETALRTWLPRDKVAAFQKCIAQAHETVRRDLAQVSGQYNALLKDWQRIKSTHDAQKHINTGLTYGTAFAGGVVAGMLTGNPIAGIATYHTVMMAGKAGKNAPAPLKDSWKKLCKTLAVYAKKWRSLVDKQLACAEKHFRGTEHLLEGANMPRLYAGLARLLVSAPLVETSSALELLSKVDDELCDTDEIHVTDYKGIMNSLMAGLKRNKVSVIVHEI